MSKKRQSPTNEILIAGLKTGSRAMLARAITLIESTRTDHQIQARELLAKVIGFSGKALRVGITGSPGVGKSTFTEALGTQLTAGGHKVAVLAIDPSSTQTRGSLMGDKTRMNLLAMDQNAYIRPSPSAGTLGGVARKTREAIILCEAAGFDIIIIETVGVGQSETAVHQMVDFFLLLALPGAGDELQGIKRGIMEMADAIVITKADGDNLNKVRSSKLAYKAAMRLFPMGKNQWRTEVLSCSALQNEGVAEVWELILAYQAEMQKSGHSAGRRKLQAKYWLHQTIRENLQQQFYHHPKIKEMLPELEKQVMAGELNAFTASEKLLSFWNLDDNQNS